MTAASARGSMPMPAGSGLAGLPGRIDGRAAPLVCVLDLLASN